LPERLGLGATCRLRSSGAPAPPLPTGERLAPPTPLKMFGNQAVLAYSIRKTRFLIPRRERSTHEGQPQVAPAVDRLRFELDRLCADRPEQPGRYRALHDAQRRYPSHGPGYPRPVRVEGAVDRCEPGLPEHP